MTIRTPDDLCRKLDGELAWRKKELSDLKYFIDQRTENPFRKRVLGRCGVTILYAHWEGFVKIAARYFLEFVAMQRLRNEELQPHLLTLSVRSSVAFSSDTRKHSELGKLTEFFLNGLSERARLPFKKGLDTESNLSSTVLKEITWCLGVPYLPFETKEKFIDARLLGRRNCIAHGEEVDVDPREFDGMRDVVIEMMVYLNNQLQNAATLRTFMRTGNS